MNRTSPRARRPQLPGPGRVVPNPEQDGLLRILWSAGHPLRASDLFGRVERAVAGPAFQDVASLANEARQLERRGFVRHEIDGCGLVKLSLTPRGRRFIGLRYGAYKRPIAASLMTPVVVACTAVPSPDGIPKTHSVAKQASLPPKPGTVVDYSGVGAARQVLIGGKKTWLWCTSSDCLYPTSKEELAPAAAPAPSSTTPAAPRTVAAPPRQAQVLERVQQSVFFGFAAFSIDRDYEAALRAVAKPVDRRARITVTGLTDRSGPATVNEKLAKKRAEAVRTLLVKEGFAEQNITILTDVTGTVAVPKQARGSPGGAANGDARLRRTDVQFEFESVRETSAAFATPKAPGVVAIPSLDAMKTAARKSLETCVVQRTEFAVPAGIRPKMHVAHFEVMVGSDGQQVAKATMVQSSGLPPFDAALAKAIDRCMEAGAAKALKVSAALRIDVDLFGLSLRERIASTEMTGAGLSSEAATARR